MDDDLRNRFRRDFTKEIIQPPRPARPAPPANQPSSDNPVETIVRHSGSHHARPRRRRRRWLLITLMVLILIGGGYIYWSIKLRSLIPASTRAAVDFPLLYPTKLPTGYHLDQSSFSASGKVVLYSAVNSGPAKIAFTVQRKPPTFDFNTFYSQGLTNSTTFTTRLGQAAIGSASGRLLGSLTTDQSWLLVSSTSQSIKSNDLHLILDNLKVATR